MDTEHASDSEAFRKYVKLCEEEVLALTGIEFDNSDSQGHPSLDFHFRQGSDWTFERIVQLCHFYNKYRMRDELLLLVELYREEPIHLHRQLVIALGACVWGENHDKIRDLGLKDFPTSLRPATKFPVYRFFLEALVPHNKVMESTTRRLLEETAGETLSRVDRSDAFKIYINARLRYDVGGSGQEFPPPIITGLRSIVSKQLDEFQKNAVTYIGEWFRQRHDKQQGELVSDWYSRSQYNEKPVQFVFAPSGSGKTSSIFDKFNREYGYYMVSCALSGRRSFQVEGSVDPSSGDSRQTCIDPKLPQGISRDTGEIFRMFEYIKPLLIDPDDIFVTCHRWWQNIFLTRSVIFHSFREALASDSNPALWLSFQLNCSEWDPFLQIFRMVSLYAQWSYAKPPFVTWSPDDIDKEVLWACIDEAQEDLRFKIEQKNLLAVCMNAMSVGIVRQDDFAYFRQAIFAGTSLNVSEALKTREEFLNEYRYLEGKGKIWDQSSCNVASKFPLVMSRDDTEAVLKAFGIENAAEAVDQSEPLWGRVKWTAMYAEKILDEIKKGETEDYDAMSKEDYRISVGRLFAEKKSDLYFPTLAEETFNNIIDDLCARLGALQKQGSCEKLLDQLLEAAISADILGRPHVFYQKSDLQLVEQGFAIVDSWMDHLESKLEGCFTIVDRTESQLTVRLKEDQCVEDELVEDGIVKLLAELEKADCALEGCSMDQLTDEMLQDGFTIVDCTMVKLATALEEDGFAIVHKSGDSLTVKPVQSFSVIENLTTEILKNGFIIWGDHREKELHRLMKPVEVKDITDNRSFAKLRENGDITEKKVKKLEEDLRKNGFLMMDITTDLPTNRPHDHFTIQGSHRKADLRETFRGRLRKEFEVEESVNFLGARLKKYCTIAPEQKELAAALRRDGFKLINKTIDEMKNLVQGSCTIVNYSTNPLVARLAEPVVIEAVIRFFIGNQQLDAKFMTSFRLASARTGIGLSAEHYLAIQLRRFLSPDITYDKSPVDGIGLREEWMSRQSRILDCLATATNSANDPIERLDGFSLIVGKQTVKKVMIFQSLHDWEQDFVGWLNDIQRDHKPSASLLIPHNDFGPDLVFAMRKTDNIKDKIVLCSIQLKLGSGLPDAVNKSSVSWACGDRKTGNEKREYERKENEKEKNEHNAKKLGEEKINLVNLKAWVNKEEQGLKSMIGENEKNLHTEILKVLGTQLKNTEKLQNQLSKAPDGFVPKTKDLSKAREILQSDFWRDQSRLSMLVAAGVQTDDRLANVRPDTSPFDPTREYYTLIGAENTNTFFGTPFETVLGLL